MMISTLICAAANVEKIVESEPCSNPFTVMRVILSSNAIPLTIDCCSMLHSPFTIVPFSCSILERTSKMTL